MTKESRILRYDREGMRIVNSDEYGRNVVNINQFWVTELEEKWLSLIPALWSRLRGSRRPLPPDVQTKEF